MVRRMRKLIQRVIGIADDKTCFSELSIEDQQLITLVRKKKLTYLSPSKLASIVSSCRAIENTQLPGIFVEAGCALGGSSIVIGAIKQEKRPLFVYDVFGVIPPPTDDDPSEVHSRYRKIIEGKSKGIGGDKYYGYEDDLVEVVRSNMMSFSIDCERQAVKLIKGLVQDTMDIDQPVAFAHIDVDWYEPVMTCLRRVFPSLVSGGSIILDDYHDWGGCRKATDEYLGTVAGQFSIDDTAGSLKITKK